MRRNFDLWERLHPGDEVRVLEQHDVDRVFADLGLAQGHLSPQVQANVLRTYLLVHEGGTWVDSTLLPTRGLHEWLPPLVEVQGFFAFRSEGDPNLVLQNWFLSGTKGHPLTTAWLAEYVDYFRTMRRWPSWKRAVAELRPWQLVQHRLALRRRDTLWFVDPARGRHCIFYPYAAHNYCLAWLLKKDAALRGLWEGVPAVWSTLPHALGRAAGDRETPESAFFGIAAEHFATSPVHKLNHRDPRFARLVQMVAERQGIELP